ncbi:MAG: sensor histidine kinase [Verrucomicrobiota bacterium]
MKFPPLPRNTTGPDGRASLDPWRGGLLSAAGHELRNRLTGLTYAAEAARAELEGQNPAGALHFVTLLQTGIERAHQQLSDLMTAQRAIDSGLPFTANWISLKSLADQSTRRIRDPRQRDRMRLACEGDGVVRADADLVSLLAGHLIDNGLRFADSAEAVEVRWQTTPDALMVEVADRGWGVPPAELPGLFEPFRHASNAGSRAGLGLGLFLARAAAEAHGGTLTLEARPGGGTLARARLPR